MQAHVEVGGKTLTGRQLRMWEVGMQSNVSGRRCEILRLSQDTQHTSVLVRWLDPLPAAFSIPGNVREGRTQWVGRYKIEPRIYNANDL